MSQHRVMPCPTCGPQGAMLPNGKPYTIGRSVPFGGFPLKTKCARCRKLTIVTASDWNRAPRIEVEGLVPAPIDAWLVENPPPRAITFEKRADYDKAKEGWDQLYAAAKAAE